MFWGPHQPDPTTPTPPFTPPQPDPTQPAPPPDSPQPGPTQPPIGDPPPAQPPQYSLAKVEGQHSF